MPQSPDECVFCKIYAGDIPGEFLYKDERCFVIRDINPVAPVHLLGHSRGALCSLRRRVVGGGGDAGAPDAGGADGGAAGGGL